LSSEPLAPSDISVDFVPRFREQVVAVPVQDEAVLYEEDTGALHQLDQIATIVCNLFDGHHAIEQITDDLVAAFGADRSVIQEDVLALARDLGQKGLLFDVQPEDAVDSSEADGDDS